MLSTIFGGKTPIAAELIIDYDTSRKSVILNKENSDERSYIFADGEDVSGSAAIQLRPGKTVEHNGVRIELIGRIQSKTARGFSEYDFFSIFKDLEPAGIFDHPKTYRWKFKAADKQYETYNGINVRLRYFLRLTVMRPYRNIVKEVDLAVQNSVPAPLVSRVMKMDVGIEDCLHIEFELDSDTFALTGALRGKVHFSVVRLKLRHMELNLLRQESVGTIPYSTPSPGNETEDGAQSSVEAASWSSTNGTGCAPVISENETVFRFEIMDGTPSKDETIPVRMFLRGLDITPTYKNIQNKFSVRYFINLVLIDEDDRRYFKKQEIHLYRPESM